MSLAYLNGQFLPLEQAQVSVLDRGFLFADSIYEVIQVYHNQPFLVEQHLARLDNSLNYSAIQLNWSHQVWLDIFQYLIEQHSESHFKIYLQVTRGVESQRSHHYDEKQKATPTVLVFTQNHKQRQLQDIQPQKVILLEDLRWRRCDIKSTALLANVLMQQQAREQGASEALLMRDDLVCEGSSSNVFIVKDRIIITPPGSQYLLDGVTRGFVFTVAQHNEIAIQEKPISKADLFAADEVWITSTSRDIEPVVMIDNHRVGSGQPGPVWQKMIQLFLNHKQELYAP